MRPIEIVRRAVIAGLMTDRADHGEYAGEMVMDLASSRGLDVEDSLNIYRAAVNHASIADLVTRAIRNHNNEQWRKAPDLPKWRSSCFTDPTGRILRRFLPVSSWSPERELYERQSWFCIGETAHHQIPMQLVVAVLGRMSGGRRTGFFSKGLLHPQKSHLRFKLRSRATVDGFRETWLKVYKEDNAQIDPEKWLGAMNDDGVLQESLFVVHIPVPEASQRLRVMDLATAQLERLQALHHLPPKQLSTCFDPISPCPFRVCCHCEPETGPENGGFDRL